jgi:hypothetical protein
MLLSKMQPLVGDDDPFDCFGTSSNSDTSSSCGDNICDTGARIDPEEKNFSSNGDGGSNESVNSSNSAENTKAKSRRLVVETNAILKEASHRRENALVSSHIQRLPLTSLDFEVFDASDGSGKGLRALKAFSYGDEILRETAAIRVPNQQAASSLEEAQRLHERAVQRCFNELHEATQGAFLELSSCEQHKSTSSQARHSLVGIYQTNSYKLGDEADGGLFLTLSRMNHSCRPNSNHIWRPDLQQTLVFATKDIAIGDEIFTTYGPAGEWLTTTNRRSYLRKRFSFDCHCEMCLEGNRNGGDRRMEELSALQEELSWLDQTAQPHAAMEAVDRCRFLLEEQGNSSGVFIKSLLHKAYQISLFGLSDTIMARDYLSQELFATTMCEGVGSPNCVTLQQLLDEIPTSA